MARQVGVDEFVRGLAPQQAMEVQAALDRGEGMALYRGGRGGAVVAVTFGARNADIVGLPPKMYGGGELDVFVSRAPTPATMRSPLMDALGGPPQISRPRVAPSTTSYPEVLLSGRNSPHPRGNAEFITPLVPGHEPEPEQPQRKLTEDEAWFQRHLQWRGR